MTDVVLDRAPLHFAPGATSAPAAAGAMLAARARLAGRFDQLASLEEDWDGYRARSIDPLALRRAEQIVQAALGERLPSPDILPIPDGGVQLEWTAGPVELELEVQPGLGAVVFVCDDDASGQRFDGELPGDDGLLALALARLSAHT